MSTAPAPWPQAARRLAARVERRDRWGALLLPVGVGLVAGSALTLAAKFAGVGAAASLLPLLLLPATGLAVGLLAMRAVPTVAPADAAWALDRLAGARGRGLAAATIDGPAGAEAAWGPGRVDPPGVRLLPARGLALSLGALLLAAAALAAPTRTPTPTDAPPTTAGGAGDASASAAGMAAAEREAAAAQGEALAAARVRDALGLTARAVEDPARVAERLADPELRAAARRAAPDASPLAALVAEGNAEDLAHALARGAEAAREAEAARRRAAALRAEGEVAVVPATRRALLERYFAARAGGER